MTSCPYHSSVITTYRRALGIPGAVAFSSAAFLSRLPISMITLGLVVLVQQASDSYSLAGQISATYVVCAAICRPFVGRLMDQLGQFAVLLVSLALAMAALATTLVAVDHDWSNPLPHIFAGITGATLPITGAAVRARWSFATQDSSTLQTAFAIEGAVDELVYMVGPTLVTVLATLFNPFASLITAMVACTVGTLMFVSLRSTEPPARGRHPRGRLKEPLGWGVVGPLCVAAFCVGIFFGGIEVGVVAYAQHAHHDAWAGPVLAIWSFASFAAGILTGATHWKISAAKRLRFGFLVLAVLVIPVPLMPSIGWLAVALFVSGFTIAPNMIAAVSWIEEVVPAARLTEGMSVLDTAVLAGVAPGAAVGGWMIDHHGASASFWVAVVAGWLAAIVAFGSAIHRKRRGETRRADVPSSGALRG